MILSRDYSSVTNNNGFWTGWSDLLTPYLQSLTITMHYSNSKYIFSSILLWSDIFLFWYELRLSSFLVCLLLVSELLLLSASTDLVLKSKSCCDWRSVDQSLLVSSTHLGLMARFLLLSDSRGFVDVERSLWREDRSVVYNCCWSSPAQSFLDSSPAGLVTIFYCLIFETSRTWRARSSYLYPPERWFSFRRLLRLAGLRRRYSNPPPLASYLNDCLYV
jgi:hypothetical protein